MTQKDIEKLTDKELKNKRAKLFWDAQTQEEKELYFLLVNETVRRKWLSEGK